jgi:hypothetical protein
MYESLSVRVYLGLPDQRFTRDGEYRRVSWGCPGYSMTVVFPSFDATFCQMVGICAFIKGDASFSSLPSDSEMVCSFRAHPGTDGKAFARLVWNPEIKHFHVDVAVRAWFGKTPPKAETSVATFRKTLALFEGFTVVAHHHASFIIPLKELPPTGGLIFVGHSGIRLSTGKTGIDLTGATLTFHRSHIRKIRWELVEDSGVLLNIDTKRRDLRVTDAYLTEALRLLDSAVATHILGRRANGKPVA